MSTNAVPKKCAGSWSSLIRSSPPMAKHSQCTTRARTIRCSGQCAKEVISNSLWYPLLSWDWEAALRSHLFSPQKISIS